MCQAWHLYLSGGDDGDDDNDDDDNADDVGSNDDDVDAMGCVSSLETISI